MNKLEGKKRREKGSGIESVYNPKDDIYILRYAGEEVVKVEDFHGIKDVFVQVLYGDRHSDDPKIVGFKVEGFRNLFNPVHEAVREALGKIGLIWGGKIPNDVQRMLLGDPLLPRRCGFLDQEKKTGPGSE